MKRKPLLHVLSAYQTSSPEDELMLSKTRQFVLENSQCFERSLTSGHITGSSWIVDLEQSHALFTHHKKLNKWMQLGGHADGMADIFLVALKEAKEESGLEQITPLSRQIFDIDIHLIPDQASGHLHYDIRFLFKADRSKKLTVSNESHTLAWIEFEKLHEYITEPSVLRMHAKFLEMGTRRPIEYFPL
jgi:8-oxo-dGTP pyrophosphatase MutT (NUDIX family)